jgi:hypothetical protein
MDELAVEMPVKASIEITPKPQPKVQSEHQQSGQSHTQASASHGSANIAARSIESQAKEAARQSANVFRCAFADELEIQMGLIFNEFIPEQDRMWANVIDVAVQEIRCEPRQMTGYQQRSLGAGE